MAVGYGINFHGYGIKPRLNNNIVRKRSHFCNRVPSNWIGACTESEVIHFYEGRPGEKFRNIGGVPGYMVEWNNKQVDITDHYCLAEIKQSGQRRFISPRPSAPSFFAHGGRKSTRRDQRPCPVLRVHTNN